MNQVYSGDIQIHNGDFVLEADRLAIRKNEIQFLLSGIDDEGRFKAEVKAEKIEDGGYFARDFGLNYLGYSGTGRASIKFTKIDQDELSQSCKVEGTWIEGTDQWRFSGNLQQV